jgi:hypothetical protein
MRQRITLGVLLGLVLAACAPRATTPATQAANAPSDNIRVQVRNDAFWDATIYLVRESSERVRLGIANGNATTTLTVPRAVTIGLTQVRFLIDWIGRSGREVSESITAAPGDTVELQIRD